MRIEYDVAWATAILSAILVEDYKVPSQSGKPHYLLFDKFSNYAMYKFLSLFSSNFSITS